MCPTAPTGAASTGAGSTTGGGHWCVGSIAAGNQQCSQAVPRRNKAEEPGSVSWLQLVLVLDRLRRLTPIQWAAQTQLSRKTHWQQLKAPQAAVRPECSVPYYFLPYQPSPGPPAGNAWLPAGRLQRQPGGQWCWRQRRERRRERPRLHQRRRKQVGKQENQLCLGIDGMLRWCTSTACAAPSSPCFAALPRSAPAVEHAQLGVAWTPGAICHGRLRAGRCAGARLWGQQPALAAQHRRAGGCGLQGVCHRPDWAGRQRQARPGLQVRSCHLGRWTACHSGRAPAGGCLDDACWCRLHCCLQCWVQ